jgi:hypothetical protein
MQFTRNRCERGIAGFVPYKHRNDTIAATDRLKAPNLFVDVCILRRAGRAQYNQKLRSVKRGPSALTGASVRGRLTPKDRPQDAWDRASKRFKPEQGFINTKIFEASLQPIAPCGVESAATQKGTILERTYWHVLAPAARDRADLDQANIRYAQCCGGRAPRMKIICAMRHLGTHENESARRSACSSAKLERRDPIRPGNGEIGDRASIHARRLEHRR